MAATGDLPPPATSALIDPPPPATSALIDHLGEEIVRIISPVSLCILLTLTLTLTLTLPQTPFPQSESATWQSNLSAAAVVAVLFVVSAAAATFLLVLLFYLRFTNFLRLYTAFSSFLVLAFIGGQLAVTLLSRFAIPLDCVTSSIVLFNFAVVGSVAVVAPVPIVITQGYLIVIGGLVAYWLTGLPEWTTWALLIAMSVYDLAAVLLPVGPLRLLVELAMDRDEEIPALVYEARPVIDSGRNWRDSDRNWRDLEGRGGDSEQRGRDLESGGSDSDQNWRDLEGGDGGSHQNELSLEGGGGGSDQNWRVLVGNGGDYDQNMLNLEGGGSGDGSSDRNQLVLDGSCIGSDLNQVDLDGGGGNSDGNWDNVDSRDDNADRRWRDPGGSTDPGQNRRNLKGASSSSDQNRIGPEGNNGDCGMNRRNPEGSDANSCQNQSNLGTITNADRNQSNLGGSNSLLISNQESASDPDSESREPLLGRSENLEIEGLSSSGGIKLGLGDFIFYSVLVARAAMFDMMAVYACYLAVIAGLVLTLLLLAVFRRALPALPISVALGGLFFLLTRFLLEEFVVQCSINLVMF